MEEKLCEGSKGLDLNNNKEIKKVITVVKDDKDTKYLQKKNRRLKNKKIH